LLVYAYGGALAGQDLEAAAGLAKQLETHAAGAGRFNLCLYHHFQAWEAMLRKDREREEMLRVRARDNSCFVAYCNMVGGQDELIFDGASVEDARKKHQFDLYYLKNNTLLLDLQILVETVTVVLFREGAQ
jgi:hypothetical protein